MTLRDYTDYDLNLPPTKDCPNCGNHSYVVVNGSHDRACEDCGWQEVVCQKCGDDMVNKLIGDETYLVCTDEDCGYYEA